MADIQNGPDDVCGVCSTIRELHGDKHHRFTLTDELIPLQPGPTPRRQAPRERVPGAIEAQTAGLTLRMIERLAQKGILDEGDLMAIFGGTSAARPDAPADEAARADHPARDAERGRWADPTGRHGGSAPQRG